MVRVPPVRCATTAGCGPLGLTSAADGTLAQCFCGCVCLPHTPPARRGARPPPSPPSLVANNGTDPSRTLLSFFAGGVNMLDWRYSGGARQVRYGPRLRARTCTRAGSAACGGAVEAGGRRGAPRIVPSGAAARCGMCLRLPGAAATAGPTRGSQWALWPGSRALPGRALSSHPKTERRTGTGSREVVALRT